MESTAGVRDVRVDVDGPRAATRRGRDGARPAAPSAPAPSPFDLSVEALDEIEDLADEIIRLAAQIHAATHRQLTLLAEFDRRRGWELEGHATCAHWLALRTGIDLGSAREKVRAARALEDLPAIGAAMQRGALSFSKVRALTRVASAEDEHELLALALSSTAHEVERTVQRWRRLGRLDEQALEAARHRSRCFSVFPDGDGMYVVKGRLDPEVAAVLMRAVDAAADALWWKGPELADAEPVTPEQRRADAVGLLAERALSAGLDREGGGPDAPISGTRAERYQVMLHVEEAALRSEVQEWAVEHTRTPETRMEHACATQQTRTPTPDVQEEAEAAECASAEWSAQKQSAPKRSSQEGSAQGASTHPATPAHAASPSHPLAPVCELHDGTRVAAATSGRLSCDASLVRVTTTARGDVLDVGRRTRTVPPSLRRALEVRDRGCRYPGCGRRFTDAHHIRHWADGGHTCLSNLLLLCRVHHRLLHEGGFTVELGADGRAVFRDPRGQPVPHLPPLKRATQAEVDAMKTALGIRPG